MKKETDEASGEWIDGMAVRSERIGFGADEMAACPRCQKKNPPTRANCLYCATPLEIPESRRTHAKLDRRVLENWEKGFNVVFLPDAGEPDAARIANYLSIDPGDLRRMLSATRPFPLARLASRTDAEIAASELAKFGLRSAIVSDAELKPERFPVRLRGIEFCDDSIAVKDFNTGERSIIGRDDLLLIVTGSVSESKTESVEKRNKKERKLVEETQTASDGKLIDIYSAGDDIGFRVLANGFDFSCLGSEKSLLASENMDVLARRLAKFAPAAKTDSSFRTLATLLGRVWEPDRHTDFHGLTRTGLGRSTFSNVTTTSNGAQFTKYSRLQRHLL